jgi:hypothetical protein
MSSAVDEVAEPEREGTRPGQSVAATGSGARRSASPAGNPLATSALAAGVAGISVITIIPALVLGVLGLRRAAATGRGAARSWFGIGAALAWAVLTGYLAPHLARAADPGCTAYKGAGLTAYSKVVADFNAAGPRAGMTRDLDVALSRFRAAAARSTSPAAAHALTSLTTDLQRVAVGVRARMTVPAAQLRALNRAAARADQACGTIRL